LNYQVQRHRTLGIALRDTDRLNTRHFQANRRLQTNANEGKQENRWKICVTT
jgi:hypothetical protein